MQKTGLRAITWIAIVSVGLLASCTGESKTSNVIVDAIAFETTDVPPAGAGVLYDEVISFVTAGTAALPDRFELITGELPEGVSLMADREDEDGDGSPDPDGALTGNARLLGFPRIARPTIPYNFTIKAISTGVLNGLARDPNAAALAAEQPFEIVVGEGRVAILNPTAAEGTTDPAVPAFPDLINFVNPANPQAFFSFAFQTAGGSGTNNLSIYMPRELELSVFDTLKSDPDANDEDTNEAAISGNKFKVAFSDGGVFNLQAGTSKVQIGGFQSPRGVVGRIVGLDSEWFQNTPAAGGAPLNSRRDLGDTDGLAGGDTTLNADKNAGLPSTASAILFSDYFFESAPGVYPYLPTWGEDSDPSTRRKYPFISTEYANAFFLNESGATPLRYNIIVEAIDTRGTVTRSDDIIARRAYSVQVKIPDINIDTVLLLPGTAGVDYMEFVGASGGVPPLSYDLEWVDGIDDAMITDPANLDKQIFGINLDSATGGFFGVPRTEGNVDLCVRVSAAVMNPTQTGAIGQNETPTGGTDQQGRQNEWNGYHQVTGKNGIHKTLRVFFASPSMPALSGGLPPGIDGTAYRASGGGNVRVSGLGGVALLTPDPVTHQGVYPNNPVRAYGFTSRYWKDQSWPGEEGDVVEDALPNALTLDGDPTSTLNGEVTGTPLDRGFHPVEIDIIDFFYGSSVTPDLPGSRQSVTTAMTFSISPDNALYMRGLQSSEGSGGNVSGLLDKTNQATESRMVPMFLEAALFATNTGEAPQFYDSMPAGVDLLPVMLTNGATQAGTERNSPEIGGFWPAEAGKENDWYYYQNRAWKHTQQETTWIQVPNEEQTRVFLWGETVIRSYNNQTSTPSAGSGNYNRRFQQFDGSGDRGILIVNPGTGEYWMPASLDNDSTAHGVTFGTEYTQAQQSLSYYEGMSYPGFYYYSTYPHHMWMAHSHGLGVYIEDHGNGTTSANGWQGNGMGRTAVSVAASADGLWCATALLQGDTQKIMIWRTDGESIDSSLTGLLHVTGVTGKDKNGDDIIDSAAIINVGGNSGNANDLLPDSLMFVDGGLVFLRYTDTTSTDYSLNMVYGFNLEDGSLSETDINSASDLNAVSSEDPGKANWSSYMARYGIFIPDQDTGYGNCAQTSSGAQFAFTANQPEAGAIGPNALAFIAGRNLNLTRNTRSSATPREGFEVRGNAQKSVFFLEVNSDADTNGLNLATSTVTDLSGSDSRIYGDYLPPGRRGEGREWLKMSDDGRFLAAVRDWDIRINSTYYGSDTVGAGYYYNSSSTSYSKTSDDVLVFSTPIAHADGDIDMDSDKSGDQHVLFIGTNTSSTSAAGSTPSMPTYASAINMINGPNKKVSGLEFSEDGSTLLFDYTGDAWTKSKNTGYVYGWGFNAGVVGTSTTYYNNIGLQMAIRFRFRETSGGPIDITDGNTKTISSNLLEGVTGHGLVGDTVAPFTATRSTTYSSSTSRLCDQVFHFKFRSPNGDFQYYISDVLTNNAYMFGVNMTPDDVTSPEGDTREPYKPYVTHGTGVSFEQFEYKAFVYRNRIGVSLVANAADVDDNGTGLVFIIGSDAASPGSATNLEIYCMDADRGGELVALTSGVTSGSSNAINYMYPSIDGNTIVAQRSNATNSRDDRSLLTAKNDIICVNNVHDVMFDGASPNSFVVSPDASHGSSVAFVGDGTGAGAVALVFSRSDGPGNASWEERNLFISLLAPQANRSPLDATDSHYVILSGGRKLDDDPNSSQ